MQLWSWHRSTIATMRTNLGASTWRLLFPAMISFTVASCTTVPVTGRHELNLISADQEMALGLSSFDQVKKDTPISHDPALNAQVERVAKRIAAVAGKDLPAAQWEFVVSN